MAQNEPADPFERIISSSNREHLDTPFRSNADLRKKHFPGAGAKLSRTRLTQAYLQEATAANPDGQLLAHATWPWVVGHAHDLVSLIGDLEDITKTGEKPLDGTKRKRFVEQFSQSGTAEIETFLGIFARGGQEFQKAILEKLKETPPPQSSSPAPQTSATAAQQPQDQPGRPKVDDLDPITRAKMSLIGTLFILFLSLIPVGIQFWRQPGESHEIVLGISGVLTVLAAILTVDYLRKKP